MKTIDIIGVFSKADIYSSSAEKPVLFKIIDSILTTKEFLINNIYLLNGLNGGNSIEEFKESYTAIINKLKIKFFDYDFSDFELSKVQFIDDLEKIENDSKGVTFYNKENEDKQITISSYFKYFDKVATISKADALFFNLQSGNVQSREALQLICYLSLKKEKYIFFQSIENTGIGRHESDKKLIELCKNSTLIDEIAQNDGYINIINRVTYNKDTNKLIKLFHNKLAENFLNSKQYFEAYYYYNNNKNIFNKEVSELLDNCFKNTLKIKYNDERKGIKKTDFVEYYLYRLMYIKFKIEEEFIDRFLFVNIERLMFALVRVEQEDNVKQDENYYYIDKDHMSIIDKGNKFEYSFKNQIFNSLKLQNIKKGTIEKIDKIHKQYRHDSKDNFSKTKKKDAVIDIFNQLVEKFNTDYSKILGNKNFEDHFNEITEKLKSENKGIKVGREALNPRLEAVQEKKKICILGMCGSTEPINIVNYDEKHLGSILSFQYAIDKINQVDLESKDSNAKNTIKLLKNLNIKETKENIPIYYIITKEFINLFFGDNNSEKLSISEFSNLFKNRVYMIPFVQNIEHSNLEYLWNREELIKMKGYSQDGYTLPLCLNFIKTIIDNLLKKYECIYVVESSGLPACKMALFFMNILYPSKVVTFQIKNPHYDNKGSLENLMLEEKGENSTREYKTIQMQESNINQLISINKIYKDYSMIISYLFQDANISDCCFESDNFTAPLIEEMKKHDTIDTNGSQVIDVSRRLCQISYLSKFGLYIEANLCLDKVLEIVFCYRLGCKLKRSQKNGRENGINNAYEYAETRDDSQLLKNYANRIDELWKNASKLKHSTDTKMIIDNDDIDKILAFDEDIKIQFNKEYQYYEKIFNLFPNLGRMFSI